MIIIVAKTAICYLALKDYENQMRSEIEEDTSLYVLYDEIYGEGAEPLIIRQVPSCSCRIT